MLAVLPAAALNHENTIGPISRGPFTVACSNIQMDTSRLAPGTTVTDYWEGFTVNDQSHYVSELLVNPQSAIQFDVAVPDQRSIYPGHAGGFVHFAGIVCHPTPRLNPDPDYVLPTGDTIPHMLPPGQAPKLLDNVEYLRTLGATFNPFPASATQKLPVIVFSHGLTGSPISDGYVQVLVELAAQGFVVAAPFHGDPRFSRVRIDNIGDVAYLLTSFDRVVEMQLMRPLSLKAMTDVLLASPYAAAVDTDRIGGFGASLGGEAMALLAGADITATIGGHCETNVPHDPRIRAFATYVPFGGWSFLPAFCQGQGGAEGVNRPFLAISGTADTTAPIDVWQRALERFADSRFQVRFIDGQHELRPEDVGDVFTWTVTFLRAYLDVSESFGQSPDSAMARFIKMKSVVGGRQDDIIVDVHVPNLRPRSRPLPTAADSIALEFFNTSLGHYFVAAGADEIANIRNGLAGPNWEETGQAFKVFSAMPPNVDPAFANITPVCRFYGV
ncbi:MAG TPA: hypothetical protein VFP36_01035, partial [Usitatibacter sp.]|nr:hypothetical protein [Usitatibacter sp.]